MLTVTAIRALRNFERGRPAFSTSLTYAGLKAKAHRQQALAELYAFGLVKRTKKGPHITTKGKAFLRDLPDMLGRLEWGTAKDYSDRYGISKTALRLRRYNAKKELQCAGKQNASPKIPHVLPASVE